MAILATDTFDRADSTDLGAVWDVVPGLTNCQIVGNRVRSGVANTDDIESYNGVTWPDDQYAQLTVAVLTGTDLQVGTAVRCSTTVASAYFGFAHTDTGGAMHYQLWRVVSGTFTLLGTDPTDPVVGDVVRTEAEGTTIRLQRNGTTLMQVTDTNLASGRAGVAFYAAVLANAEGDAWEGGNFATRSPMFRGA